MVEVVSNDFKIQKTNKMDCTILDYFTKLKNETESDRIVGGIELLKYLLKQNSVSIYLKITLNLSIFV